MRTTKSRLRSRLEKLIANGGTYFYINWINATNSDAIDSDNITALLFSSGFRPNGQVAHPDIRGEYENGVKQKNGRYIRFPQEEWTKQ